MLCQVVLIQRLPDERLDDRLPADVQVPSSLIQFLQHARGEIQVYPLNRLNHAALALKEMGNVFASIRQPRNSVG